MTGPAFTVGRGTGAARGGHFAAMEAPAEFVEDVRSFFREVAAGGFAPADPVTR